MIEPKEETSSDQRLSFRTGSQTTVTTEGKAMLEALISEFGSIEDPRCAWKVEHKLLDILVIAICAV